MSGTVNPEDYQEPRCPLDCGTNAENRIQSIPQLRVLAKLDEYLSRRDYEGAERHLLYWLEEAKQGQDLRGQLLICNEMIGYYRKNGQREKTFDAAEEAIRLLDALGFFDNLSAGTTYVNAGTAYSAFGEDEKALPCFSRAKAIYEGIPNTDPELLGGLYNNMGLTYAALEQYSDAYALYSRAIECMKRVDGGELEQAITCLNMADALEAERGRADCGEQISGLLKQAGYLLQHTKAEKDSYYAFVCEKCASGFRYYGDTEMAQYLEKLAEEIYERT